MQADSAPISESPQLESTNDSLPIEIDSEEEEEQIIAGSKRKLKSVVWNEFTLVQIGSREYAKCNHCSKKLSALSKNGTNHLKCHLKSCTLKRIKLNGQTLVQSGLRFDRTDAGKISVENYTFDQDIARKELGAMIVLHEYPLSMVDHVGFRRFVGALQPLFRIGTRNTIRYFLFENTSFMKSDNTHQFLNIFYFISDLILWHNMSWRRKKPLHIWLGLSQGWLSLVICGHLTTKREVTWPSQHTLLMNLGALGTFS
jgi:hypothetical protein